MTKKTRKNPGIAGHFDSRDDSGCFGKFESRILDASSPSPYLRTCVYRAAQAFDQANPNLHPLMTPYCIICEFASINVKMRMNEFGRNEEK